MRTFLTIGLKEILVQFPLNVKLQLELKNIIVGVMPAENGTVIRVQP
jgi:hypothetical protein